MKSPESEHDAQRPVQPCRAERRDALPEEIHFRLLLPASPEHAQMGKIQLMGQKSEDAFGVEFRELQPVRRGAVGADEERQKMFVDLQGQVSQIFLVAVGESGIGVLQKRRQLADAEADVRSVVGEADVGGVRKHDEVPGDDARLAQFPQRVELAAAQDAVAQVHVFVFLFATAPPGQAGVHEKLPVEGVGDAGVYALLADRRVR